MTVDKVAHAAPQTPCPCPILVSTTQTTMKNQFQSLTEDRAFLGAIEGLQSFTIDNNADCDMAYDWVCDQADCHSFVCDNAAWDMFYDTWQSAAEDAGLDDAVIAGDSRY